MSYTITSISYDPSRKLIHTHRNVKQTEEGTRKSQFVPVPYTLDFELYVIGKNQSDVFQIIEKIIPYFTPKFSITINSIPSMGLKDDMDITLRSAPFEDPYIG